MTVGGGLAGVDNWLRAHHWLPDAALAIVLAAILLPASLPLVLDSTAATGTKAALVVAMIVAQGTVAFRRIRPVIAYLVCCVAMAVQVASPSLAGLATAGFADPVPAILLPTSGVYLVLLYSVAAWGAGRMPLLALLVAGFGVIATTVRLLTALIISSVAPTGWPLPLIVVGALSATVIAAWSLGRFRRLRQEYVISLAERARLAEADRALRAKQAADGERARIAREMHDVVSHSLAVMVAQAEAGRMAGGKDPALGIAVLPTIASTGREAMSDMRSLLGVLREDSEGAPAAPKRPAGEVSTDDATSRDSALRQRDSPSAPQPQIVDIPALVDRVTGTGLPVRFQQTGTPAPLGATVELAAYRVVQEALTNTVKHAGMATAIAVQLVWSAESLTITVTDDGGQPTDCPADQGGVEPVGVGCPAIARRHSAEASSGQGLIGMRERVSAAGGVLSAGLSAAGFQVVAELPIRRWTEPDGQARRL